MRTSFPAFAEAEDIAQHEHGALLRREALKADDERERYRLLGLVARLRSGGLVRDALEQDVRVRLKPDRLGPARRLGHLGHPLQVFRTAPARARTRIRSVALVTLPSSHRPFLSPPPHLMTSRRLETRRSVFVAADASTNEASNGATKGEPKWERS